MAPMARATPSDAVDAVPTQRIDDTVFSAAASRSAKER